MNYIPKYAIKMNQICKSFLNGKVIANDKINLEVKHNEIHAIIGENGAGKSTLMSILFGIYKQDSGTVFINDKPAYFSSAKDATAVGLGMVHQHFKLVPTYSIYENIILGSETIGSFGILKHEESKNAIQAIIKKYKFNVSLNSKISSLTVGQQQKTEILKLLYRDSNILIFDEPTAVLSQEEIQQFLQMLLDFKKDGKTVIIITHKLSEIKAVADRATVIRHGKYICDFNIKDKTINQMAELMVGKKLVEVKNDSISKIKSKKILEVSNLKISKQLLSNSLLFLIKYPEILKLRLLLTKEHKLENNLDSNKFIFDKLNEKSEILKVKFREKINLVIEGLKLQIKDNLDNIELNRKLSKQKSILYNFNKEFSSKEKYKSINFNIKSGEIFAIAGVEGNGQSELALILSGLSKSKNASIKLLNREISNLSIQKRKNIGLSHIPEDRHKHGLILDLPIYMNTVTNSISEPQFSKWGFLKENSIKEYARFLIQKYDVRGTTRGTAPARLLSGGNQQKLIIGREITNQHKLIILVQPTRGLDLGAIEYIHYQILREKEKGNAVLLISYELDEILSLADKIAVMYNNKFIDIGNTTKMTKQYIGQLMAGKD